MTSVRSSERPGSGLSSHNSVGSGRFNRYGTYSGSHRRITDKNPTIEKLSGCAHFHYDFVELAPIKVNLLNDGCFEISEENSEISSHKLNSSKHSMEIFRLQVCCNSRAWIIERSTEEIMEFDRQIHRCVFDRRYSNLKEFKNLDREENKRSLVTDYYQRFSDLAGSLITCYPVLKWLELDNRGNRLMPAEETPINTPGRAAAYVVREYIAQANDELSLKLGDIVSVIDMPPASESIWWKGKLTIAARSTLPLLDVTNIVDNNSKVHEYEDDHRDTKREMFEVGFFPNHCVQLFGAKMRWVPDVLKDSAASKPVFRKRGKVLTFLRGFLLHRPQRRRLKETGVLKERIFGCDLAEHLLDTGLDVPMVLTTCAHFIEEFGLVDGIYRLSGAASNINKLRNILDTNNCKAPELTDEQFLQDVHSVASLLKMYFRELPNPLFTYQLYNSFVDAVEGIGDRHKKILRLHEVVTKLPPPHFRTAEYLMSHLSKVGDRGHRTGMHHQNLAIVWAPNLFRCREIEGEQRETTSCILRSVNTQAVITEYLIRYCHIIFSHNAPANRSKSQHSNINQEPAAVSSGRRSRPRSMIYSSDSPSKLIDLQQAQAKLVAARHEKVPLTAGLPDLSNRKCIDVNGGPEALPKGYHTVIDTNHRKRPVRGWRSFFPGRQVNLIQVNRVPIKQPYTLPRRESCDNDSEQSSGESVYGTMQHQKGWDVRRSSKRKQTERGEIRRPYSVRPTVTMSNESLNAMLSTNSATESSQASPQMMHEGVTNVQLRSKPKSERREKYQERAIDIGHPPLASLETLDDSRGASKENTPVKVNVQYQISDDDLVFQDSLSTLDCSSSDVTPIPDPRLDLLSESRISAPASITLRDFGDFSRSQSQPPFAQDVIDANLDPKPRLSQDPIRIMVNADVSFGESEDNFYADYPAINPGPISPDQYFSESEALRVKTCERLEPQAIMTPSPSSDPENYCVDEGSSHSQNSSIQHLLGKTVNIGDETMERSDFRFDLQDEIKEIKEIKDDNPVSEVQNGKIEEQFSQQNELRNKEPKSDLKDLKRDNSNSFEWTTSKLFENGDLDLKDLKGDKIGEYSGERELLEKLDRAKSEPKRTSVEWNQNQVDLRKYLPELVDILDPPSISDQQQRSSPASNKNSPVSPPDSGKEPELVQRSTVEELETLETVEKDILEPISLEIQVDNLLPDATMIALPDREIRKISPDLMETSIYEHQQMNFLSVDLPEEAKMLLRSVEEGLEKIPAACSPRSFDEVTATVFGENSVVDVDSLRAVNGLTAVGGVREDRERSDESDLSHSRYENLSSNEDEKDESSMDESCAIVETSNDSPKKSQPSEIGNGLHGNDVNGNRKSNPAISPIRSSIPVAILNTGSVYKSPLSPTLFKPADKAKQLIEELKKDKHSKSSVQGFDVVSKKIAIFEIQKKEEDASSNSEDILQKYGSIRNKTQAFTSKTNSKQHFPDIGSQPNPTLKSPPKPKDSPFMTLASLEPLTELMKDPIDPISKSSGNSEEQLSHEVSMNSTFLSGYKEPFLPPTPTPRVSKTSCKTNYWKGSLDISSANVEKARKPNELLESPLFKRQRDALASPRKPNITKGHSEPPDLLHKKSTSKEFLGAQLEENETRLAKFPVFPTQNDIATRDNNFNANQKTNAVYYV